MNNLTGTGKRASKSKKRRAGLPDEEGSSDEDDDDDDDDVVGSSRPPALFCLPLGIYLFPTRIYIYRMGWAEASRVRVKLGGCCVTLVADVEVSGDGETLVQT